MALRAPLIVALFRMRNIATVSILGLYILRYIDNGLPFKFTGFPQISSKKWNCIVNWFLNSYKVDECSSPVKPTQWTFKTSTSETLQKTGGLVCQFTRLNILLWVVFFFHFFFNLKIVLLLQTNNASLRNR